MYHFPSSSSYRHNWILFSRAANEDRIIKTLNVFDRKGEFNVLAEVDDDLVGHLTVTPDDKQAAKTLVDLCICWSATISSDCGSRPRDANMGSVLQGSALQIIDKGCRGCLVKDLKITRGRLGDVHIKVILNRVAVALQLLQNMIRRKDSIFFILNNGSNALSKLLSPLVEAQDVLQQSRNRVECACENEYSMAVRLAVYQHRIRKILLWKHSVRKMTVQFNIAVRKYLTPIRLSYYTDHSSRELTGVTKEVVRRIEVDLVVYAVLYSAFGLLWSERPMIIHDAIFSLAII